ncbi:hypothetical protein HPP92_007577 [Vanilla planifolia]|uniref:Acid phosphatase n=1 Tax=Vanilla planifolia TaxID=51239 RepID=A0A835RGC7_VANPL|nr:hypothetical protein HPP92_007577 [Vanilla planifolia]
MKRRRRWSTGRSQVGNIHETVIGPLAQGAGYYYRCSVNPAKEFFFKMPPAELPIKFAVVGDLGQTGWTKSTLDHISKSSYDVLLLPGDLSYADLYQPLWDSFGRLVEPLSSARPWMVTHGNHEIEKTPLIHPTPFEPYNARWHMPFEESSSPSNLFYSFSAASGTVHVLMLGSYADFARGSDQYGWLQADLAKVDRARTPWLLAVIHAPWVFDNREDECGAVHITIGDGGNKEGLASEYEEPQPSVSLFREASFGHGRLDVVNATHALWTWHRNDDEEDVVADSAWIHSLAANQRCTKN